MSYVSGSGGLHKNIYNITIVGKLFSLQAMLLAFLAKMVATSNFPFNQFKWDAHNTTRSE